MPTKSQEMEASDTTLDKWATDPTGPVALHLKQKLLPVESLDGDGGIVYPPTYANIGYNIDTLSDGTKVALIDSIGSQANRMEPIFKATPDGQPSNPLAELVPQIEIVLHHGKRDAPEGFKERVSILDIAHRSADAVVMSSPTLSSHMAEAFGKLRRNGDCGHLCALAPTSLVFGVWDSRGGSNEKLPRLVRSVIRAWDVNLLRAAAQYNSVWKNLDEGQQADLRSEEKKKGRQKRSKVGLADAPAVFRDSTSNIEARVLGGVLVRGRIEREVTVNLVALRGLRGPDQEGTECIQKYLLGLSLLAATADMDMFLREGCHLRYAGEDAWYEIPRRGEPTQTGFGHYGAERLADYTKGAFRLFRKRFGGLMLGDENLEHKFDLGKAKELLVKKHDED